MLAIIVAIASFIVFNYVTIKNWGWEWNNFVFSFVVSFGSFIGSAFICLIVSSVFMSQPIENCRIVEKNDIELVALKDGSQIEGTAFLFSTAINQELQYTYIYDTEMGKTTGAVDANECYIKYISANETPHIKKWAVCPKSKIINWLFACEYYRYTIYLPEGSIIESIYEIDLE